MRFIMLFIIATSTMLGFEQDSLRRVPKLDLEALSPDSFAVESDMSFSAGWFPGTSPFRSIELIGSNGLFVHDGMFLGSMPIPGSTFKAPGLIFQKSTHYSIDDRLPLEAFSSEESDEEVIEQAYQMNALRVRFSIPEIASIMRIGLGLRSSNSIYFAEDKTVFLNLQGTVSALHELHAISINEMELTGNVSMEVPIYGVLLDAFGQSTYSHYSLFAGMNIGYVLESDLKHQSIIMEGKDAIRYPSGSNILTVQSRSFISAIDRMRISAETGIGWQFGFGPLHLGFEGYLALPLNSMLKQGDMSIIFLGIRGILGISF